MRKNINKIDYSQKLNLIETQIAIKFLKEKFQKLLEKELNLLRVSAPLFVETKTGLNDGLNGIEKPVNFSVKGIDDNIEIVQSLAKWKRMALKKYSFPINSGLYTDMNAIRKDENIDFIHSLYVDQWDWELVIGENDRNLNYLKKIVRKIYKCIYKLNQILKNKFDKLELELPNKITFISTKELEDRFPDLSRKEREDEICRIYKAVFIYQIGWPLSDGLPHDGRASDYDDWNLNGDLLIYYPLYDMGLEISSMGIRVDEHSLLKQVAFKKEEFKLNNSYCNSILNKTLPNTIGGGIGQSRLSMLLLEKAHIGEVQSSIWPKKEKESLNKWNIDLL